MGHKSQVKRAGTKPMSEQKSSNGNGSGNFKFSEVEQTLLRNLNGVIAKHKGTLAEIQLQILALEEQRAGILQEIKTANGTMFTSLKEATKAHGVDLDAPNAGKWNVDMDTMTCTRTDVGGNA